MDHIIRIQRAIDCIEESLKNELSLHAIAQRAGFSIGHFQRVFSSAVGDTVKEYLRKRRLSSALHELARSERRILDIAHRVRLPIRISGIFLPRLQNFFRNHARRVSQRWRALRPSSQQSSNHSRVPRPSI